LLLAEPYGRTPRFGLTGNAGHAGVYLTGVCATTPTVLRRCQPGEAGVVIARYEGIGELDWVAIPLIPYLYAVERAANVPTFATPDVVLRLRDEYRRAHLRDVIPERSSAGTSDRWMQFVGAAYDRQIVAFSVKTMPEQDDALIAELNGRENRRQYSLLFGNCADFARDVINRYHPGAIRSSIIADFGFATPKQIAKAFVSYATRRRDTDFAAYLIPQIPGSRRDSSHPRGVVESLLKTKKYTIPLAVVQPWVPAGLAVGYIATGRFDPYRYATRALAPLEVERRAVLAANQQDSRK